MNLKESLHLFKLTGGIRTIHYPSTLDQTTHELCFIDRPVIQERIHVQLLTANDEDVMFPFPYKDVGRRLDMSTTNLLIFGNKKFEFNDDYNFLHPDIHQLRADSLEGTHSQNVLILKQHYVDLKDDCAVYCEWLATDHLGLTCQWFLRNAESHVSDCFDVIRSDVSWHICQFYNLMMYSRGKFTQAQSAWQIHWFLVKNKSILSKRFLFFEHNVGENHWIISCMANPWFFILKEWKNKGTVELPFPMGQFQEN